MDDLEKLFTENRPTTLTFDCYGTLVDWERGATMALRRIYGFSDRLVSDETLIDMFLQRDAAEIRKGVFPYRKVLENVALQIAGTLLGRSDKELARAFALTLPSWSVFAETNAALAYLARRFRLAIISNVDDDLLSGTLDQIETPFDAVITSQQTGSYKPEKPIFEAALQRLDEAPHRIIHIAEGLCEAAPARDLGMMSIWVKRSSRSDEGSNAMPRAWAPDLMSIVLAAQASEAPGRAFRQIPSNANTYQANHD